MKRLVCLVLPFALALTACSDNDSDPINGQDVLGQDITLQDNGDSGLSALDIVERDGTEYASAVLPISGALSTLTETPLEFTASAPTYDLPVDLGQVVNLEEVLSSTFLALNLTDGARDQLAVNGSAMIKSGVYTQFFDAYDLITMAEFEEPPILVTSDALLHLYHMFFDQLLKFVEVKEFVPILDEILPAMVQASLSQASALEGEMGRAALRNAAYFAVAVSVLRDNYEVPDSIKEQVSAELDLIGKHEGLAKSPIFNADCPANCDPCDPYSMRICTEAGHVCYCEDYSQYVPRGHYTQTDDLKRYFKAMMWLGRVAFRIRTDIETRMAVLATDALKSATLVVNGVTASAPDLWFRIYQVTGFFTGAADDLTFMDYDKAVIDTFGEGFDLNTLESAENLASLKDALRELRQPAILSNFISAYMDVTEETQGWRFMGQRFAPDSYVLGQMVWNHIGPDLAYEGMESAVSMCFDGAEPTCDNLDLDISNCICEAGLETGVWGACRLMPRGLDVMAVLGQDAADRALEGDRRYCNFDQKMTSLKDEFALYTPADWMQTAYWGWLHALKPLMGPFGEGYPTFMTTDSWADKELNTTLASWTELRHDTILYVKQSYTPGIETTSEPTEPEFMGYVEPVPHFYNRLAFLTAYTKDGLTSLDVMPEGMAPLMDNMSQLLGQLAQISVKELEDQELLPDEKDIIRVIGPRLEYLVTGLAKAVAIDTEDPEECGEYCQAESNTDGDGLKTSLVADVHTDGNTKQVLEEGAGNLDWVIVINRTHEGNLGAAIGPVFTYYEFPHPMANRLTDEQWREMLGGENEPARPTWIKALYGE